MENKRKIDLSKLTPEQRDKLEEYEQSQKQLQSLEDIASILQELVNLQDDSKESKQLSAIGAVLTDAREQLVELNKKETPESPDFSKPVVEALSKLEKSFQSVVKSLKVDPTVNVAAPNVEVAAPDLSAFNKVLKTELPKAFKEAIKLIPKVEIPEVDNAELLKAWEGISEQLLSIEAATRMKPQFPNQLKVVNPDGSAIYTGESIKKGLTEKIDVASSTVTYIAQAMPGTATSTAAWRIKKITVTGSVTDIQWAGGSAAFTKKYDSRTLYTYV